MIPFVRTKYELEPRHLAEVQLPAVMTQNLFANNSTTKQTFEYVKRYGLENWITARVFLDLGKIKFLEGNTSSLVDRFGIDRSPLPKIRYANTRVFREPRDEKKQHY